MRHRFLLSLFTLLIPVLAIGERAPKQARAATATLVDVVVHEGTSMAVSLSRRIERHSSIDLQGGLWTLPIGGGTAKRITDEYNDARQPSWSPDGKRIAFQGYRDGTWRIWSVTPDGNDLEGDDQRTIRRS